MIIEDGLTFEGRRENLLPNNAFQPTPSRCALGFPRSLRSLGAAERGR